MVQNTSLIGRQMVKIVQSKEWLSKKDPKVNLKAENVDFNAYPNSLLPSLSLINVFAKYFVLKTNSSQLRRENWVTPKLHDANYLI